MKFSELYRILENDGWYIKATSKHKIYIHDRKTGIIAVSKHKSQEVPTGTLNKILKDAGIKL